MNIKGKPWNTEKAAKPNEVCLKELERQKFFKIIRFDNYDNGRTKTMKVVVEMKN